MAKIITIDTSTNICSVALHENGNLISSKVNREERSHSKHLTIMVEETLKVVGLSLKEVDAFAISKGPGSYTGLRIGVATVKGYCYALDKPMISINTLEGMWYQIREYELADYYVPMIDARRMEVYNSVFDSVQCISKTEAKILDVNSFSEYAEKGKIAFFGDGSTKFQELIGNKKNYNFVNDVFPDATFMGNQVYNSFKTKDFEDLAYFEPFYLKDFVTTKPKKLIL